MQRTRSGATKASWAALAVLVLGGCGAETSAPDGGDNGSPDSGAGAETAALTDQPFCERVQPTTVAEVLGMPADKVRTQVDRAVGEEFEGPDEEATPPQSVANLCVFGSSTSQFTVSVQPDATSADVQETVDEMSSLTGEESSESCESGDATGFGNPAAAFTCTTTLQRERVVVTGLVGDSKFYCAASLNLGAGKEFEQTTLDACRSVLEELSADA